jgi:signal transduction histidine kinase/ligand-binding sensor domain-containing protein
VDGALRGLIPFMRVDKIFARAVTAVSSVFGLKVGDNRHMERRFAIALGVILASCPCSLALNPSLDISQYAHTSWTVPNGFSLGNIYGMAQTPDGYLWLGGEFGLFRFDGVRSTPWEPPAGQRLPDKPFSLLVTRDGAVWIGTYAGLATWSGGKLTRYPELDGLRVTSLLEARDGTVWAGLLDASSGAHAGRLCAIRNGGTQCYGKEGAFGSFVWGLYEDSSGGLWAGAESGLWRWKPGPPRRYATPGMQIAALSKTPDGRVLIAMLRGGLKQVVGDKVETYPIRDAIHPNRRLGDRNVNANKLLWDHDEGLWIGTRDRGLIHVHESRTDVFKKSDGLSGDTICSLFEDREGDVWVATTEGLDRFRELPVTTVSVKQRLFSNDTNSIIAAIDGSIWVATQDGLARWKNGQITFFLKSSGLPDNAAQSLFQDHRGRVWVYTGRGLAYFKEGRFVAVDVAPSKEVYSITGDAAGNVWLSGNRGLSHLRDGHLIEQFPWSAMGHREQGKVVLSHQGGVWISFLRDGGVAYFKDGQVRASYTVANGLGKGDVPSLQLDRDGALWAATEEGGLSRIKDGRATTLTTRNGLPCDAIHFTTEDNDSSLWLYSACGLVRVTRKELDAWIADPKRRVETTVWGADDGVRLRPFSPDSYGPPAARLADGKLWFLTGEGVQVVDPHHIANNRLPPPVHVEQIIADDKPYSTAHGVRLPANVRNLRIEFTALSLVAPEKIHFKYKLEGQNGNWHEVINERHATYTNIDPRNYQFRVIASNNSGVWNETGDTVEFSIAPAYYQTTWFLAACVAAFLAMLWGLYRLRLYQIAREFHAQLDGRVDERLRVARELHDTLLQSFQASLIQMQAARNVLERRPETAGQSLDKAITVAAGAIAEGRSAIQDLRLYPTGRTDLAQLLIAAGQELATSEEAPENPPALRVTVEGERQDVKPLVLDEVYRIARELLRNAFRHAQASRIEVEIRYEGRQLRLHVRDDGKGIDPKILEAGGRAGHWGMPGMRERVSRFGGKLEFWSEAGAGTEAVLTVPGAVAYGVTSNGGRFAFLRRKKTG